MKKIKIFEDDDNSNNLSKKYRIKQAGGDDSNQMGLDLVKYEGTYF
jgi:hypothetical protein